MGRICIFLLAISLPFLQAWDIPPRNITTIVLREEEANLPKGTFLLTQADDTQPRIVSLVAANEEESPDDIDYDLSRLPDIDSGVDLQPCHGFDSCRGRCLDQQATAEAVAETDHFNCQCDPECTIFRDCCWDYYEACVPSHSSWQAGKEDMNNSTESAPATTRLKIQKPNRPQPRFDAFECTVVDQYSKEHFWVITKCSSKWPDDEIRSKCNSTKADFLTLLPVQGDTGWTYRNAFCAQCNYVDNFQYWTITSRCFQAAPKEILAGDPEMLSFYLLHFCNIELKREVDSLGRNSTQAGGDSEDIAPQPRSSDLERKGLNLMYNLPLRRCDADLIDKCPDGYDDDFVIKLCEEYQSVVVHRISVDEEVKVFVFKNPACAFCHGIKENNVSIQHPGPPIVVEPRGGNAWKEDLYEALSWIKDRDEEGSYPALECPIWMLKMHYDLSYWSLTVSSDAHEMLPQFRSSSQMRSNWTPPSFTMLMHFREDGSHVVEYTEDGNRSAVETQTACRSGQIYDPFYAICRAVVCPPNHEYKGSSCVVAEDKGGESVINYTGHIDEPLVATVTVVLEVPTMDKNPNVTEFASHFPYVELSQHLGDLHNTSVTNVSIIDVATIESDSSNSSAYVDSNNEQVVTMAFSFIVVEPGDYTDEEIIQFVDEVGRYVQYQMLLLDAQTLTVLVLSTPIVGQVPLVCMDGTSKLQYAATEYELREFEGRYVMYVNSTDTYYLESEYELLDWSVKITENGTERNYVDDSRAVVCANIPDIPSYPCNIYLPLNQSEYIIQEDGSIYLIDRNVTMPEEMYISYDDSVAICVDDFLPVASNTSSIPPELLYEGCDTICIIVWVNFALTMASLLALLVTFSTYVLFSELRTVAGWCIMNLTVSQFASVALFMFGANATSPEALCTTVTIHLHFLFLSVFFWNNVMAFDVWRTFGKGIKNAFRRSVLNRGSVAGANNDLRNTVIKYMAYGWGVPAAIVVISASVEFLSDLDVGYKYDPAFPVCWISNPKANIIVFGVPVLAILLANTVFFALSIRAIRRSMSKSSLSGVGKQGFQSDACSLSDEVRIQDGMGEVVAKSFRSRVESVAESCSPKSVSKMKIPTGESAAKSPANTRGQQAAGDLEKSSRENNPPKWTGKKGNGGAQPPNVVSRIKARTSVTLYIKMSTVMGFTWIIGFAASFAQVMALWIIFEFSVSLQGVFILWAFVCKKRILLLYKSLLCRPFGKTGKSRRGQRSPSGLQRFSSDGESRISRVSTASSLDDVFFNENRRESQPSAAFGEAVAKSLSLPPNERSRISSVAAEARMAKYRECASEGTQDFSAAGQTEEMGVGASHAGQPRAHNGDDRVFVFEEAFVAPELRDSFRKTVLM